MPSAKLNGVNIYYEVYGTGKEAIILLGGLGMTCEGWILQSQFFSEYFRVIVMDNRGSGRSCSTEADFTISDMADDTLHLMNFLSVEKAHLICHSMGGFIGLEFAHKYPDRVSSLIFCNTASRLDSRSICRLKLWEDMKKQNIDLSIQIRDQVLWIFPQEFFNNEMFFETALKKMMDYPFKQTDMGYSRQVNACVSFDSTNYLKEIKSSVMVLASDDDLIIPVEMAKKLASDISGSHWMIVKDCGHMIPAIKARKFNRIVMDFINSSKSDDYCETSVKN